MTFAARGLAAAAFCSAVWVGACGPDPEPEKPGTVFRQGPATPEEIARPLHPPIVEGGEGQVSIYDGYFVRGPCATPLQVDANRGDTILVRLMSKPDSARADNCQEEEQPTGYAVLVGQFEPAEYAVRVVHEGDRSRPAPLDTVYENIIVTPRPR